MIELANTTRTSTAAPDAFFARWIDHATWPQWSPDTTWARVDGPVRTGAHGTLKPTGGPTTSFTIAECEKDRVYTDVSSLVGAKLTFRHTVEAAASGSELTVRVWLDGPLSRLWAGVMGKGLATSAPEDLDRLIALVEAS